MNNFTKILYAVLMIVVFATATAFGQASYMVIEAQYDSWGPQESSFEILDVNGNQVYFNQPTIQDEYLLDTLWIGAGSYTAILYDQYGDAWQDTDLQGYFRIWNTCQDTMVEFLCSQTNYFATETIPFMLGPCNPNAPPPPPCLQATVIINLDQYQSETSWQIADTNGMVVASGSGYGAEPDYGTVVIPVCLPQGPLEFTIMDTYGDGLQGSLWQGQDGSYFIKQCNDTLVYGTDPAFGNDTVHPFVIDSCPPIPGCTDPDYLEYNPFADVDDGSCLTVAVYGCIDSTMYNYDPNANAMLVTPVCEYKLTLHDLVGNGWVASNLKIVTPDTMMNFTHTGGFTDTYYFYLPTGTPVTSIFTISNQASLTTIECGFTLTNPEGDTVMHVPAPFIQPIFPYQGVSVCPNECIDKIFGCTDTLALNYQDTVNTDDGSCYYVAGCMNPLYLEYNNLADYDDGSCSTLIVVGCMDSTAYNYDPAANVELAGSCIPFVYGCMDPMMFNYDPLATANDTCISYIYGCTDPSAFNYNVNANTDNGNCIPVIFGCTDSTAFNFDPLANTDNSSCIAIVEGCTNPIALNYDPLANTDDFSCILPIYGCMDSTAFNYDELANVDNGTCVPFIYGCTNPIALNYCDTCNTDDFSCVLPIYGCTDSTMFNYNPLANVDNGSCIPFVYGCTDPNALNYNSLANIEDFSCIDYIYGCTDSTMFNYNPNANTDNGSCLPFVYGCTDADAINYNILANTDDGTCIDVVLGCTDSTAFNYDILANTDDGSCIPVVWGCTDGTAFNFNSLANTDDGSCIPVIFGCIDPTMFNYCDTCNTDNGNCIPYYYGCTDSTALNYDDDANTDNGSCIYPLLGCTDPTAVNYNINANVADSSCYYSAGCNVGDVYYIPNECFEWVIQVDPYCCDVNWDSSCEGLYTYCIDGWSGPTDIAMFERMGVLPYPNPSTGNVYFNEKVDIKVYDTIGKLVLEKDNISSVNLSKGVYLIKIEKENINLITKIIIK